MYLVIEQDGSLRIEARVPSHDVMRSEVGAHGYNRVALDAWWSPRPAISGWASDCGLALTEVYTRNVIGSCVMVVLGAAPQPYGGPIMITGYDPWNEWDRVQLLVQRDADAVAEIHHAVAAVLNTRPSDPLPALPYWVANPTKWADGLRVFAHEAEHGAVIGVLRQRREAAGAYLLDAMRR